MYAQKNQGSTSAMTLSLLRNHSGAAADRGPIVSLTGPADPGTATPLTFRPDRRTDVSADLAAVRQADPAAPAGNKSRYRTAGADPAGSS